MATADWLRIRSWVEWELPCSGWLTKLVDAMEEEIRIPNCSIFVQLRQWSWAEENKKTESTA
jgi:hypothetical protein